MPALPEIYPCVVHPPLLGNSPQAREARLATPKVMSSEKHSDSQGGISVVSLACYFNTIVSKASAKLSDRLFS